MIKLCGALGESYTEDPFNYLTVDSDLTDRKARLQDLVDLGEALDVYNTITSLDDVAYSLGYLCVECSGDWELQDLTIKEAFIVNGICDFNITGYTFEEAYALYFLRLWCLNTDQRCPYTLEFSVVPFLEFMPDLYNIDVSVKDDYLYLKQGHTCVTLALKHYNLDLVDKIITFVARNKALGNVIRYTYFGRIYVLSCRSGLVLSDSDLSYRIIGSGFRDVTLKVTNHLDLGIAPNSCFKGIWCEDVDTLSYILSKVDLTLTEVIYCTAQGLIINFDYFYNSEFKGRICLLDIDESLDLNYLLYDICKMYYYMIGSLSSGEDLNNDLLNDYYGFLNRIKCQE